MLLESGFEIFQIHFQPSLPRKLCGQFDGESVGVVQSEYLLPVHELPSLVLRGHAVEVPEPFAQGLPEFVLLAGHGHLRHLLILPELRVGVPVVSDDYLCQIRHECLIVSELAHVSGCSSYQSSEYVSAPYLGRHHPVCQHESGSAHVIRYYPEHADILALILSAGYPGDAVDQVFEYGGLVDRRHSLQYPNDPLQAHPGVDVLLLQRSIVSLVVFEVLHEHVVPDLCVLPAVAGGAAVIAAFRLTVIVEYLGIRSAGPGYSRRAPPVVLHAVEEDLIVPHAQGPPYVRCLLVAGYGASSFEGCHGQLVGFEPEHSDEEVVAESDRFLLEVVSERPVAQHLEEGEVAGIANVIYVPCPDAFLAVDEPLPHGVALPEKVGNKRVHARSREEHGGVVLRHQGC